MCFMLFVHMHLQINLKLNENSELHVYIDTWIFIMDLRPIKTAFDIQFV